MHCLVSIKQICNMSFSSHNSHYNTVKTEEYYFDSVVYSYFTYYVSRQKLMFLSSTYVQSCETHPEKSQHVMHTFFFITKIDSLNILFVICICTLHLYRHVVKIFSLVLYTAATHTKQYNCDRNIQSITKMYL